MAAMLIAIDDTQVRYALREVATSISYWGFVDHFDIDDHRWELQVTEQSFSAGQRVMSRMLGRRDFVRACGLMSSRFPTLFGLMLSGEHHRTASDTMVQLAMFRAVKYGKNDPRYLS